MAAPDIIIMFVRYVKPLDLMHMCKIMLLSAILTKIADPVEIMFLLYYPDPPNDQRG